MRPGSVKSKSRPRMYARGRASVKPSPHALPNNGTKQSKASVCSRQGLLSILKPKASLVAAVGAPRFSRGRGFASGRKNFRPVYSVSCADSMALGRCVAMSSGQSPEPLFVPSSIVQDDAASAAAQNFDRRKRGRADGAPP